MSKRQYRWPLGLLALTLVVLSAGLGLRDPWPADEPRFALIARDMVISGDWLIPRIAGALYPDKPPLFFWLIAAFYKLTGSLRIAFLLPSIAAGVGVIWLVMDLGRRLWHPSAGLWAGAILLGTVQFTTQMKAAQIDGVLCFLTTLAIYGLCRHLLLGPAWGWYTAGGVAAGVGVMTKGVGFLPLLILLPYAWARCHQYSVPRIDWCDLRWLLAPLSMLIVVASWLVPMWWVTTSSADPELIAYRDNILLRQTIERYATPWGHIKPPWYFLTNAIPLLWQPLVLFLPWLWREWRRCLSIKDGRILLLGGWVILILVFFSLSAGKRSLYIFPALPVLALLAAPYAAEILRHEVPRRTLLAFAVLVCLGIAIASAYLLTRSPIEGSRLSPLSGIRLETLVLMLLVSGAGAVLLMRIGVRHTTYMYLPVVAVLWVTGALALYPDLNPARSGRLVTEAVLARLPANSEVGFVGWKEQFALQWPTEFTHFGYRVVDPGEELRQAIDWLRVGARRHLLVPDGATGACVRDEPQDIVAFAHRTTWRLVDKDDLLETCELPFNSPGDKRHARSTGDKAEAAQHATNLKTDCPVECCNIGRPLCL